MAHNSVNVVGKVNTNHAVSNDFKLNSRIGGLDANGERTVFDTNKPYVLDYLEWSCNHEEETRIEILIKTNEYPNGIALTRTLGRNGAQLISYATPKNIMAHYAGIWDILDYDENVGAYKFRLKLPNLECPKGITIKVHNSGGTSRNIAVLYFGRELR